jgi:iron complex transport system substrate-binding protein
LAEKTDNAGGVFLKKKRFCFQFILWFSIVAVPFIFVAQENLIAAVSPKEKDTSPGIRVSDFRGKTIYLESPAQRIICLIESALSGLYMLGAENQVIGISTNVYQKSVLPYYSAMDKRIRDRQLPTPGNWDFLNIEMVVGLRPDLVIIWSHQQESIAVLEEKGIPVYGVFIEKFEDINKEIIDLGRLTGKEERASQLVSFVKTQLEVVENRLSVVAQKEPVRAYFMWAQGELRTSGKNSTVQQLFDLAGVKNVAGHIQHEHLVVNLENIISWDPQIIVMWHNEQNSPADIMNKHVWRSVSAVQNRRVHEFPDVFSCDLWTLKYLYPVLLVAKLCYPEKFEDIDLAEQKKRLFDTLYNHKIDLPLMEQADEGKQP